MDLGLKRDSHLGQYKDFELFSADDHRCQQVSYLELCYPGLRLARPSGPTGLAFVLLSPEDGIITIFRNGVVFLNT
jgi:hypothetical protein